ncbi:MAG TPA: T9SS type A sorting domain-containing protein [Bacteroidota bacterium]
MSVLAIALFLCIPGTMFAQGLNSVFASTNHAEAGPAVFRLNQNYPNPFNPTTNISFAVPSDGRATLRVFNLIGQEVGILFDGMVASGKSYRTKFDGSNLPSGVYFSRLDFFPNGSSSAGIELMRKMTLMK